MRMASLIKASRFNLFDIAHGDATALMIMRGGEWLPPYPVRTCGCWSSTPGLSESRAMLHEES